MKLSLRTTFTVGLMLCMHWSIGQTTLLQAGDDRLYLEGLNLFDLTRYSSSQQKFRDYLRQEPDDKEKTIIAEYYVALSALKMRSPDFESAVTNFIRRHPAHPKTRDAYFQLGTFYFEQGDYGRALEYLEYYNLQGMRNERDIEAAYRLAYTYFALERYKKAGQLFNLIKNTSSPYAQVASYYAAYVNYLDGNYEQALTDLSRANLSGQVQQDARTLTAAIYYKQGRYDDIIALVKEENGMESPEMSLLAGETFFLRNDFGTAMPYFERFLSANPAPEDRQTNYRIGFTYLHNKQATKSQPFLSKAADGEDKLAQAGAYHLGMAYLATRENTPALTAFNKARRLDFDKDLQEAAAYYSIKVSSAMGEFSSVIDIAERFAREHPRSERLAEVYSLLGDAYQKTGDYDRALDYLMRVPNKTPEVQAAIQRVAFNRAVLAYNDAKYPEAIRVLQTALRFPADRQLAAEVNFWAGEIFSLNTRYDSAITYYQRVPTGSPRFPAATYGLAYAFFNTERYAEAAPLFQQFVRLQNIPAEQRTDAYVRLGDSFYVLKRFDDASNAYNTALRSNPEDPGYIHYQLGMVGLGRNTLDMAVEQFNRVISNHPSSPYASRAMFQRADVNFENGRLNDAIRYFSDLIDRYPDSPLLPYALAKRANAARNSNQLEIAVRDQKRILDEFISIQSLAETAIEQLQLINGGGFAVQNLNAYVDKFSNVYRESEVVLKARFEVAQRNFNAGDYLGAIQPLTAFAEAYPNTALSFEAWFNLGFSYEMLEDFPKAVDNYKRVQGSFRAQAVRSMADISLNQLQNYPQAVTYYTELLQITDRDRTREAALEGLLRANFEVRNLDATLEVAEKLLERSNARLNAVANLYKGKVALERRSFNLAMGHFQNVIAAGKSENAAEAQYLIGKALREQGQFQTSIDELVKVRTQYEAYRIWLYEAFLLIAENYVSLNDQFQARATLQSIIDYADEPDIIARARKRLSEL